MSRSVLAILGDPPRVVDADLPLLRADDTGVLRGESAFETIRLAAGRPAFLPAHLARLAASAARVDIALPDGWAALAHCASQAWGDADGVLRLVCTKGGAGGPVGYALATEIPPAALAGRDAGVSVVTLTLGVPAGLRAEVPWLLGGVKSTSYAVNMAALRAAHDQGADDAIFVSTDGEVLEAPTSSVCWITAGRLVTPPAAAVGILPGTTLEVVLRLAEVPTEVRRATAAELRESSEVMLLSSVRGVAPVVRLDGRDLHLGPVTRALRDAFEAEVRRP